jgi:hypothetical protein
MLNGTKWRLLLGEDMGGSRCRLMEGQKTEISKSDFHLTNYCLIKDNNIRCCVSSIEQYDSGYIEALIIRLE